MPKNLYNKKLLLQKPDKSIELLPPGKRSFEKSDLPPGIYIITAKGRGLNGEFEGKLQVELKAPDNMDRLKEVLSVDYKKDE